MSQFLDIGNPLNDPRERLIVNTSRITCFSIVSRMGESSSYGPIPETNSEFLLLVELKSKEKYVVELDGLLDEVDSELYQPSSPDQIMDEFLSSVVNELKGTIEIQSLLS